MRLHIDRYERSEERIRTGRALVQRHVALPADIANKSGEGLLVTPPPPPPLLTHTSFPCLGCIEFSSTAVRFCWSLGHSSIKAAPRQDCLWFCKSSTSSQLFLLSVWTVCTVQHAGRGIQPIAKIVSLFSLNESAWK